MSADATEHAHASHDAMPCPGSCPTPSTSTTPPCGTAASRRACRSPSTTSCGSPSSSTTSASSTSRAAGRAPTPRTRSSSAGPRPASSTWSTATLVAFGSTRKAGGRAETDPVLAGLLAAETAVVCLVAKSAEWHVTETLRTTLTEAVDMVADSVGYLVSQGRRVFLDAEHFFDGYRANPRFSTDVLRAAADGRRRGPGAVRHQRRQPALRGRAGGRRGPRPGRRPSSAAISTTTPAARSPTPSWPSGWAPPRSRAASTATASGPATPT